MIRYKTVPCPVGLSINRKEDYATAVKQYASIIDSESVGGWKFEFIRKIPVTKKAGCLASLFGQENTTLYMNMLVFSKDDAGDISSSAQTNGEINGLISQMDSEETNIGTVETSNSAQNTDSSFEASIPRGVMPETPGSTYDERTTAPNADKKKTSIFAGGAIVAAVIIGILIRNANVKDTYDGTHYDSYPADYSEEYDESDYSNEQQYYDGDYENEDYKYMSAEEFTDKYQGIWVDVDGSYDYINGESESYSYIEISNCHIHNVMWPIASLGEIIDVYETPYKNGLKYDLTVYYEATSESPEATEKISLFVWGDNLCFMVNDSQSSSAYKWIWEANDIFEALDIVRELYGW